MKKFFDQFAEMLGKGVVAMKYTVTAERGISTRRWTLQCIEVPGALSEVTRRDQAEECMREAIAFVADIADSDIEIELQPVLPTDALRHWAEAERLREQAAATQHQGAAETRAAARALADAGLPVRDIGTVLGVSYQRAHQLISAARSRSGLT